MLTLYLLNQKYICQFAKRSILRAYLRYIPAFIHSARGVFNGIVGKGAHNCLGDILIYRCLPQALKNFYFGLMAVSLIENVRFCPARAWFASRVIVAAVTLITFTELSELSIVLRTE